MACLLLAGHCLAASWLEKPRTYSAANPPTHAGPVTIAFWNIENFTHVRSKNISSPGVKIHVAEVAKVINKVSPTVLAPRRSLEGRWRRIGGPDGVWEGSGANYALLPA